MRERDRCVERDATIEQVGAPPNDGPGKSVVKSSHGSLRKARQIVACVSLLVFSQAADAQKFAVKAAARYVPGVIWHTDSVIRADFTCRGRKQTAILGDSPAAVVVAVFLGGLNHRPEVLRFTFLRGSTKLGADELDYDPKDLGYPLPGFQRSKSCKGLSLDDGETDPAHLYWNHQSARFDYWRN